MAMGNRNSIRGSSLFSTTCVVILFAESLTTARDINMGKSVRWYSSPCVQTGNSDWLFLWNGFSPSQACSLPCFLPSVSERELVRRGDRFFVANSPDPIGVIVRSPSDLSAAVNDVRATGLPLTLWIDGVTLSSLKIEEPCPSVTALVVWDRYALVDLEALQVFPNLKALWLSTSVPLDASVFSRLSTLSALTIQDCPWINDLEFLDRLPELIHLDLGTSECRLKTFPSLPQLRTLSLPWSITGDQLDHVLSNTPNLISLTCDNCSDLAQLGALKNCPQVRYLALTGGRFTNVAGLRYCPNLHTVDLSRCEQLHDISELAHLQRVRSLQLRECAALRMSTVTLENLTSVSFPPSATNKDLARVCEESPNLRHLQLRNCADIDALVPLRQLQSLKSLQILFDQRIDTRALADLSALTHLTLRSRAELDCAPLRHLASLEYLELDYGVGIRDAAFLSELTGLTVLDLAYSDVSDVRTVAGLPKLAALNLEGCESLRDFSPLKAVARLSWLDLSFCSIREIWEAVESNLLVLSARGTDLASLSGLRKCAMLRHVDFSDCERLVDIHDLGMLSELRGVVLRGCRLVESFECLSTVQQLSKVCVGHDEFNDVFKVGILGQVVDMEVEIGGEVIALRGLEKLTTVRRLAIRYGAGLSDVGALAALEGLRAIEFDGCEAVTNLDALEQRRSLKWVKVTFAGITDLRALAGCAKLIHVDVTGCRKLFSVDGVSELTRVMSVNVSLCDGLQDVSPLRAVVMRGGRVLLQNGERLQ